MRIWKGFDINVDHSAGVNHDTINGQQQQQQGQSISNLAEASEQQGGQDGAGTQYGQQRRPAAGHMGEQFLRMVHNIISEYAKLYVEQYVSNKFYIGDIATPSVIFGRCYGYLKFG